MKCYSCNSTLPQDATTCPTCGKPQGFDQRTIDRAIKGDQTALTELYTRTYSSVYNTIKFLVRDDDAALDILQDSYVKAFRSLDMLQDPSRFGAWVKRIAHNRAIDWLRKEHPVSLSSLTADESGEEVELEDDRPDSLPDEVIDQRETARLLNEILDSLPDDQRVCVTLFYYDQLSVHEIASELDVPEATVKSRLFYGRKKIESQVKALEKRGTRLYGMAPAALLMWLLRNQQAQAAEVGPQATLDAVLQGVGVQGADLGSAAAGGSQAASADAAAGATSAVGNTSAAGSTSVVEGTHAAAGGAHAAGAHAAAAHAAAGAHAAAAGAHAAAGLSLGVKVAAAAVALALVGGGTVAARRLSSSPDQAASTPAVATQAEEAPAPPEPPTPPVPTAPSADAAQQQAWEPAYQVILQNYRDRLCAVPEDFLAWYDAGNDQGHDTNVNNNLIAELFRTGQELWYGTVDFNGDGIDELVLGTKGDGWTQAWDIYTFDGDLAVPLFVGEDSLAYRKMLFALPDGTLVLHGSNGAYDSTDQLFRVVDGGTGVTLVGDAGDLSQMVDALAWGNIQLKQLKYTVGSFQGDEVMPVHENPISPTPVSSTPEASTTLTGQASPTTDGIIDAYNDILLAYQLAMNDDPASNAIYQTYDWTRQWIDTRGEASSVEHAEYDLNGDGVPEMIMAAYVNYGSGWEEWYPFEIYTYDGVVPVALFVGELTTADWLHFATDGTMWTTQGNADPSPVRRWELPAGTQQLVEIGAAGSEEEMAGLEYHSILRPPNV